MKKNYKIIATILVFVSLLACNKETKKTANPHETKSDLLARADSLAENYEYEKANSLLREILSEKDTTIKKLDKISLYNKLALNYRKIGEYDSAFYFCKKALEFARTENSENSLEHAQTFYLLGLLYRNGKPDSSEIFLKKSLEIRKKLLGEKHPLVGDVYNNLGVIEANRENYAEALAYYKKAVELRRLRGESDPSLGSSYMNIANLLTFFSRNSEALAYYDSALAIQKKLGADNPRTAYILVNLGALYGDNGEIEKSVKYYKEALEIFKKVYGENHPYVAVVYNNLATAKFNVGDYETATEYLYEAIRIREKSSDVLQGDILDSYLNLGEAYFRTGKNGKAAEWFERALEMAKRLRKPETVSRILSFLSEISFEKADTLKALSYTDKALENTLRHYPKNSFQAAETFLRAADAYYKAGKMEKAERFALQAVKYWSAETTRNDYWLVHSLLSESKILFAKGEFEKSLKTAEKIEETVFGNAGNDKREKVAQAGLTRLFISLKFVEAQNYYALSRRNGTEYLQTALEESTEAEKYFNMARTAIFDKKSKTLLARKMRRIFDFGIKVAYELNEKEPKTEYFERALNFAEKCKSLVLLENISERQLEKFARVPDSLVARRNMLRAEITRLQRILTETEAESGESEKIKETRKKLFAKNRELENFNRSLAEKFDAFSLFSLSEKYLTVEKIIDDVLDTNRTAIEFSLAPDYLYAFVISPENKAFVRTEVTFDTEKYVNDFLEAVKTNDREKFVFYARALYGFLFAPIEKHIFSERILIVNDGILNYVPYDALLTAEIPEGASYKDFPFLIKKYATSYAFSLAVLAEGRNADNVIEKALGVAPLTK